MTISNKYWNDRLSNLERCAEDAPQGTYEFAKDVAGAVDEVSNHLLFSLRARGLKADNCDALREVEAAIYAYIVGSNLDDESEFDVSEGFGYGLLSEARRRMIRQAARDRAALALLRA